MAEVRYCPHNGCDFTFTGQGQFGGLATHARCRAIHLLNCKQPCQVCVASEWKELLNEPREECLWCGITLLLGTKNDRDAARKHQKVNCQKKPAGALLPASVRACPHTNCDRVFTVREMRTLPTHAKMLWYHVLNCEQPCGECEQRGWCLTGFNPFEICPHCKRKLLSGDASMAERVATHIEKCPKRPGAVSHVRHDLLAVPVRKLSDLGAVRGARVLKRGAKISSHATSRKDSIDHAYANDGAEDAEWDDDKEDIAEDSDEDEDEDEDQATFHEGETLSTSSESSAGKRAVGEGRVKRKARVRAAPKIAVRKLEAEARITEAPALSIHTANKSAVFVPGVQLSGLALLMAGATPDTQPMPYSAVFNFHSASSPSLVLAQSTHPAQTPALDSISADGTPSDAQAQEQLKQS